MKASVGRNSLRELGQYSYALLLFASILEYHKFIVLDVVVNSRNIVDCLF